MGQIKPIYLLAGKFNSSGAGPDPLIQEMLHATGRPAPAVAYIGAASGDNPHFFKAIKRLLVQAGAGRVELVSLAASGKHSPAARVWLESADVLFFSGGDVELGMQILRAHKLTARIRKRFHAGAVLAGLSAGSILLARQWIRWRDPEDDATAESFNCLGLAPLICDMHDEDEDWEELKALLRLRHVEGEIGYGIPAGMGLRILPDQRIEAIGGGVHRFIFRKGRVE